MSKYSANSGMLASNRLYYCGLKNKNLRDQEYQHIQQLKTELESRDLTFQPEINDISRTLVHRKSFQARPIYDRLIESGKCTKEKLNLFRAMKDDLEQSQYTHHPKLDPVSQKINEEKSKILQLGGTPRHEQLYLYSKIKNEHLKFSSNMQSPQLTFQPQINRSFSSDKTKLTFFERQHLDCREREYKQKVIEDANSAKTLRERMHPELNKTSEEYRREDLGKNLYESAFKTKRYIEEIREQQDISQLRKSNENKILATSKRFVEELTDQRISELFTQLDSDDDGLISATRINIEVLDAQVCKILSPFLYRLSDNPELILDLKNFTSLMKKFIKMISIEEKRVLLQMGGQKSSCSGSSEHTFQPKICDKSRKLASKIPADAIAKVRASPTTHQCEFHRSQREVSDDRECVFRPRINLYRPEKSAYCK